MDDYGGFEPQVGEIRALRTFRIGPDGRLYPLFSRRPWNDATNTAHCRLGPIDRVEDGPHTAPDPDCTCGYYAYGTEAAAGEHPHSRDVLAVVSCWGDVIAGTRGIRAEHARIEALWLSSRVPADLAGAVAASYPSSSLYQDKSAMLAEHPPTSLDCYLASPRSVARMTIAVRVAVLIAFVVGILPASWIWHHDDARVVWLVELSAFLVAAATLRLTRTESRSRGAALFFTALALWLIAPFAGTAGTILLRLPIIQIAVLGGLHRSRLNREARRFPARI